MAKASRTSNEQKKGTRFFIFMGCVWATCVTLPFFETFLFYAHASSGRQRLSNDEYARIAMLLVALWALMCFVFLVERDHVKYAWSRARTEMHSRWRDVRQHWESKLVLLLIMIVVYVFVGTRQLFEFVRGEVREELEFTSAMLAVVGLIWFGYWIIKNLSGSLRSGMREGVDNWAVSFGVTVGFYALLVGATFVWITFKGVNPPMRLDVLLSLIKDYVLLFIISNVLYVGLFKLARARTLVFVFRNLRGFLHFVTICGIIAVMAVWADYRQLDPSRTERIFPQEWQRRYLEIHIVGRDIFLLLLPIGCLLFWTVLCVGHERPKRAKRKTASALPEDKSPSHE